MAGIVSLLSCGKSSRTLESETETEQQEPQARWELLQLRQWEQQIRESCTSSCIQSTYSRSCKSPCIQSQTPSCPSSCIQYHTPPVTWSCIQSYVPSSAPSAPTGEDEKQCQIRLAELPEAAAATFCPGISISSAKAKHCQERIWHQDEATRTSSPQEQQQNNALLSSNSPKTNVKNVPKHNAAKNETVKTNYALNWDAKTWRQNLFNEYVDQWNRVQAGAKSVANINYSDGLRNSTLQEQEDFDLRNINGERHNVENARRKKEISEQRYLEALRRWAYLTTAAFEEGERSRRTQVQNNGEARNNYKPLEEKTRKDQGKKEAKSLRRQGSQIMIPSQDWEQILEIGAPQVACAIVRPKRGCGGKQKIEGPKKKRGPDNRRGGTTADLKRSERKPSDQQLEEGQCNRSMSPMKIVLKGRGRVIQDGTTIILQGCENPKGLEGMIKPIERAGRPENVPFKELGRRERIRGADTQNGGVISTFSESEKLEGFDFDSKESKCREINSRPTKESNRRTKGSRKEMNETQDPKGYKSRISKKGGKDLPEGESGRPEKQGNGRQQWGQVVWTACTNNKCLIAAAHGMQSCKNNAAAAIEERKLSCLHPRSCLLPGYRTLYRLKDTNCEELRDDLCGAMTYLSRKTRNQ